jgi:hypothetical protein
MKQPILFSIALVAMFLLSGCGTPGASDGVQNGVQTVGHTTWQATKAVGFGLGYVTQKIGQGLALAGRGVAASGGALETASKH